MPLPNLTMDEWLYCWAQTARSRQGQVGPSIEAHARTAPIGRTYAYGGALRRFQSDRRNEALAIGAKGTGAVEKRAAAWGPQDGLSTST